MTKKGFATSALEPCPSGSQNCIRTTWVPPSSTVEGTNTVDVRALSIKAIQSCLASYPQEGQHGVDRGGWEMADDQLETDGTARLKFKSGNGPLSMILNLGKPFVDDVLIAVQDDGRVEIRSSSRIGKYDLGVNQKRLRYLGSHMPKEWDIPDPSYK